MKEFQDKFIEEALELIDGVEAELLGLESNPEDKLLIDEVFRVMHTLKGASSMFGFNSIEAITHHLETIYDLVRDDELKLTKEILTISFDTVDLVNKILRTKNTLTQEEQNDYENLLKRIENISGAQLDTNEETGLQEAKPGGQEKENQLFYIHYKPNEDIYFRGVKPFGIFYELEEIGEFKAVPFLDRIPKPEDFNPDKFYLHWDIFLKTNSAIEDVEDIFIFFDDNEAVLLPIEEKEVIGTQFINDYNQIKSKRLPPEKIQNLLEELTTSEEDLDEILGFERFISDETGKEAAITKITEKSKDVLKKTSTLRVSAEKLDHLITNVSEFVTLYSQISLLANLEENEYLKKPIQALGKLSKKLRDNALELRLVPVNELAIKMRRLIRDLSIKLDKEIEFITDGVETELDKTIIDNLEEPIMHIIRNSIDHGIEDKDTRLKLNKSAKAIVRLSAYHSGAYVFIQIQDDGKGIDGDIIKQKAVDKGLISPGLVLSKREIYDLLFEPGFTTAESVSKISGRGVGMNVVKQKIIELRGEIEIDSEIGLGTSVTIKLPLTLSIIDTLKIKVEKLICLLPLANVEKCIRVRYDNILKNTQKQYEYENNYLPMLILRNEFDLDKKVPKNGKLVIVKQYDKKYCILVDDVLGDHQAVVKPMGDLHKKHPYFSGASVMGDGSLGLILDTNKMFAINKELEKMR